MLTRVRGRPLEDRLLLYCSQTNLGERNMQKAEELINRNLDWKYFARKAIENYVFPQVYHNLIRLESAIDKNDLSFRHIFGNMKVAWHNLLSTKLVLYSELRKILKTLKTQQIRFMPLKGITLAETVYPRWDIRYFSDIDLLLLNRKELEKAEKLLFNLGYRPHFKVYYGYHLIKNQYGLLIICDLQYFLPGWCDYYPYPTIPDIWDTSLTATIEGVSTPIMTAENMFLLLSLHSFRSGTFTLRDLCDALEILKKSPEFDWGLIINYAKQELWRYILVMFLYIFSYASEALGENPLPQGLLKKINRDFLNLPIDNNIRFPVPYTLFCRACDKCRHCPVILKEKIKEIENLPLARSLIPTAWNYFWESILLFKFVRPIRTLLRCYYGLNKRYFDIYNVKRARGSFEPPPINVRDV